MEVVGSRRGGVSSTADFRRTRRGRPEHLRMGLVLLSDIHGGVGVPAPGDGDAEPLGVAGNPAEERVCRTCEC